MSSAKAAVAVGIVRKLRRAGHEALWAGGCVRDMLLGAEPADYDVATSASPEEVCAVFPRTVLIGAQFGVVRVLEGDSEFEVTTFRGEQAYSDGRHPDRVYPADARTDAARRDFTVNALFYDPLEERVIDYVGGRADLTGRLIRAVGDPGARMSEDRLRPLRAVRFAARLCFDIEEGTAEAVRAGAEGLGAVSAERVRDELEKMLVDANRARAVRLLDELGLLERILPEVSQMKGTEQDERWHKGRDVFEHTLESLRELREPSFALAFATLLHDIGKPVTSAFDEERDRITFYRHCAVGAGMAVDVCRRLKMSRRDTERVEWLVRNHLYLVGAREMRRATLKRIMAEEGFDELLELFRVDTAASHNDFSAYDFVVEMRGRLTQEELAPPPLITGKDLIALGYEPGPLFGEILEDVRDRQLGGELSTHDEAIAYLRDRYRR